MKNLLSFTPLLAFLAIALLQGSYSLVFLAETHGIETEKEKLLWCASAITFDAAILTSALVSGLVLRRFSRAESRRFRLILYSSLILLLIVLALGIFIKNVETPAGDSVLGQLKGVVPNIGIVLKINNRLAWFSGILMVASASLLIHRSEKANARELGSRLRYFRAAMYSGSALLAAGIVEIYQLYKWAEAATAPNNVQFLSTVLPVAAGFLFSAFLVAIFLPPAIFLDNRYRNLTSQAAAEDPEFNKENWLLQNDLSASPLRVFSSYLAALLPVAAGLLIKLGERIL